MTHLEFIKANFTVLAETENAILSDSFGELCCEINGAEFACNSIEEFHDLMGFFGDDLFEE